MIDKNYLINVRECMIKAYLPKPKHRSRFLIGHGEILPLIIISTGE